jgi:F0F1-type ATP synthase membrane subunit b/b'
MTSIMRPGEETQSVADQAKERAHDTAREVKGKTREQLRSQLEERSTQIGSRRLRPRG